MAKNLGITLVRTLIAVVENASMTVVVNALHLTQDAISQQIKRLEDAFECRLFERDGRRLEPTHAGEQFLGHAKRPFVPNDEIWADMAVRPLQGLVRLGIPYDLVGTALPPIFEALTEAWPPVKLTTARGTSSELTERIVRGELDVVVVKAPVDKTTGECPYVEWPMWVGPRGSNAYAKRPLPLSMMDESCIFRARVLKALGEHGVE